MHSTDGGPNDPIVILKKYRDLQPQDASAFYMKPMPAFRPGKWYTKSPVGVHGLSRIIQDISKKAGWDSESLFTGHYIARNMCNKP